MKVITKLIALFRTIYRTLRLPYTVFDFTYFRRNKTIEIKHLFHCILKVPHLKIQFLHNVQYKRLQKLFL